MSPPSEVPVVLLSSGGWSAFSQYRTHLLTVMSGDGDGSVLGMHFASLCPLARAVLSEETPVAHTSNSCCLGNIVRPSLKIKQEEQGFRPVVEHLPSTCKTVGSIPGISEEKEEAPACVGRPSLPGLSLPECARMPV